MSEIPIRPAESLAAIGRHPVHPMLIPYPIAFLTSALATDVAARRTGDPFWSRASRWLLAGGIGAGIAAGAVGAIDYYGVDRVREHAEGRLHALGNVAALVLAGTNLALRRDGRARVTPGAIALSTATASLLGVTGWLGGELSYRYKVGVMEHESEAGAPRGGERIERP